jgi:DNA-nicking Smr family endonuclease
MEPVLDLHTFRPSEVADLVEEYLHAAHEEGHRQVRLIHGKGTSRLKFTVEKVLQCHPRVVRYTNAPEHQGGWGATIVELVSK